MIKKIFWSFAGIGIFATFIGMAIPTSANEIETSEGAELTDVAKELPVIQQAGEPFIEDGSIVTKELTEE